MSIYFFSLFPLCPINISSLSKNLIFQIQHKRHISIYTSIQEGFLLWKKVEDSQQMAYFNKLSYGSLWKIIILKS